MVQKIKVGTILTGVVSLLVIVAGFFFYYRNIYILQESNRFKLYFFVILCLIIIIMVYLTFFYFMEKIPYHKIFLCLSIMWGCVFTLALPPLSAPDEWVHIGSAYQLSNVMMGKIDDVSEFPVKGRAEDAISNWDLSKYPSKGSYRMIAEGNWFGQESSETKTINSYYSLEWYKYIPAAVGITLARVFHLGKYGLWFAGRIGNIIAFALIGMFAVKITPVGKAEMISVSLFPMLLELYSSYSYDAMSNALCMLYIAICMRCASTDSKLQWYELLGAVLVYTILSRYKGIYYPMILLLLMIPHKKWKELLAPVVEKKKILFGLIFVSLAVVIFFVYKGGVYGRFMQLFVTDHIASDSTELAYSFPYALNHIEQTALLWKNTFLFRSRYLFGEAIGQALGWLEIRISWWLIIAVFACEVLMVIAERYIIRGQGFRFKQLIWCWLALIGIVIMGYTGAMISFTPITSILISGMQGRYFLPAFMMMAVVYGTDAERSTIVSRILFAQNILLILCVGEILQITLNR